MERMMHLWTTYRSKAVIISDQAIVSGTNFLLGILLVRYVGIHVFGEFSLVLIVTQGIVAINQALITSPYQSLYAQNSEGSYLQMVKGMQVVVVLFLILTCMLVNQLLIFLTIPLFELSLIPFLAFILGTVLFDFNRKQLYLQNRYIICLVKDGLTMGGQLLAIALGALFFRVETLNEILLLLGGCFLVVEVVFFFVTNVPNIPHKALLIQHWVFGRWMVGNAILQWFSGNFYITVGATLLGPDVVGILRIGQSIIGVWNVFIQALENYVPPIAALIYKENGLLSLKKYLLNLALKGGVAIGGVATLIALFRSFIWEQLYGTALLEHAYILLWFAPILVFNFMGFPFRFAIRTLGTTRVLFEAYVFSALLGFSTAHIFINAWGIHGVCLGLLLTQVIMQLWYSYRLIKFYENENHSYRFG